MDHRGDELYEFLHSIDMLQYYDSFRREGFERLESIAEIQETDFEELGVKRGHRRLIRRKALEIVNPLRYSRELPPINSPLILPHPIHQPPLDLAPSPSLEEIEPLTVYLHRQHPQHSQSQSQLQQQPQQPASQQQSPLAPPPMQPQSLAQPYYSQAAYYYRHYSPQSRQAPHSHAQRHYHQQQLSLQYQHPRSAAYAGPSRQTIPFPKPSVDDPSKSALNLPIHSPISAASASGRPQLTTSAKPITPLAKLDIPRPVAAASRAQEKETASQPPSQPTSAHSYPTVHEQHPISASTEAPSPQKSQAPTSPFPGPAQHVTPLAIAVRSPLMRRRTRGQSISSAAASTSSRRRDSRSDARAPYSRSNTDPHLPQSPASPQSPKRTYRRHPKKDPNAPEKWRSAYQLFRDDVNRDLQGQDIPFSEMSRIHSRRWAELDNDVRATYFEQSRIDKEEYSQKMAFYEQTLEHKHYEEYLEQFYKQESTVNRVGRPKGTRSSKGRGTGADRRDSQMEESVYMPDTDDYAMDQASSSPPQSQSQLEQQQHPAKSPQDTLPE